jgi:hypothetical protein
MKTMKKGLDEIIKKLDELIEKQKETIQFIKDWEYDNKYPDSFISEEEEQTEEIIN